MGDDYDYKQNENNINYKSICCEQIPEIFLDKLVAKKHFSKFGKINRFILRPKRLSCTVEYETEDGAERAYMEAGNYNGHEFTISYSEREVAHVQNTEEWVDPDVQAELDAMNPSSRFASASLQMRHTGSAPKMFMQRPIRPIPQMAAPQPPPPPSAPSRVNKPQQVAAITAAVEQSKIVTAQRSELEAILRRPAYTYEDKYRVLDARDKLIRLTTVRQTDIKKAVSTKGTCPDMCPEKERLMREFQRQVSTFEMSENSTSTISHRRAIKEYSRSSADQEVPLAHELRPESVLQMTMLYLMHRIMDLCDDPQTSIADWFHFVWDRTRSIRKDITQQELCSLAAVELVEQCARFHIHCAARLVAEDPSVFDKKINAENLTKCLQSLKYMYHDLRVKNIPCPCEAEFRSYIVLLNLGDANFLWELKQLPAHIQNSLEIKRAIAFYNALQNNNYVRFFDMVRSEQTSYLSACILLGYFNRLRIRAMDVIVKAHNWRKNDALPLAYLTAVLGFEDKAAAINFFEYHGLECDMHRVGLSRLARPDIEYSMDRALLLVESKRKVSVGECVCGHRLKSADIFEQHEPHNSFDGAGYLKPEAWTADDQLRGEAAAARAIQRNQQQQMKPPATPLVVVTRTASPTNKTDANIFKVPHASPPPISPKQQQQQQQQKQLQQKSTTATTAVGASIFGGQHFAGDNAKKQPALANFRFVADGNKASTHAVPTNSNSIFKIPIPETTTSASTGIGSSSASLFNSVFQPEKPLAMAGGSIFGGTPATAAPTRDEGVNIFSTAAKESVNMFQQPQRLEPAPMRNDNIFQHYQAQASTFDVADGTKSSAAKSLFGAAAAETKSAAVNHAKQQQHQQQLRDHEERLAVQEKRRRELEEQQKHQQQQLELERQKLKEMEEKLQRQRQEELERKHREKRLAILQVQAEQEADAMMASLLAEQIHEIASHELQLYRALENRSAELTEALIVEVLDAETQEIVHEEYAIMCYDQMLLHRYFDRWLQHTQKKLEQRHLMESTPIWVTTDTRAEQTERVAHPSQELNLQMIKRYRHGEPCDFRKLLWNADNTVERHSVDLFQIIWQNVVRKEQIPRNGRLQMHTYFKLLLTLPSEMEELPGFESLCNHWLEKHIKPPATAKQKSDTSYICSAEQNVALCVRKLSGVIALNEMGQRVRDECDNADAIVCFMSCINLQSTRKRLHYILKLASIHKSLPLAIVVFNSKHDESDLVDLLDLDQLVEDGKVFSYRFYGHLNTKSEFSFVDSLKRSLRYVVREASHCNIEAEALEMQSLQNWMECNLGEEMWCQRWQESALKNPSFRKICSMPQHVIGIYHEALDHLKSIIAEDLNDVPEFPAELRQFVPETNNGADTIRTLEYFPTDWKNPKRKEKIIAFLKRIHLPAVKEVPAHSVEDLELWLLNYGSQCILHDDIKATEISYQAIKVLIDQLNCDALQEYELDERLTMVNYLPVVKIFVYAHINNVLNKVENLPTEVIYRRQALVDYQQHPWWLNYKAVQAVTVDYSIESVPEASVRETESEVAEREAQEFQEILQKAEAVSCKAEQNLRQLRNRTHHSAAYSELKRELSESFYNFEVAKQCGAFDFSFIDEMSDEDNEEVEVVRQQESSTVAVFPHTTTTANNVNGRDTRKRKINAQAQPVSEIDMVIKRALHIIEKVDAKHDEQDRLLHATNINLSEI